MDSNKRLRWSRRLSFVPRWSIVPTIRQQTVDAHCFHVAHTSIWLLNFGPFGNDPDFRLSVLEHALEHDIDEAAEGDAPTPGKVRKNPGDMNDIQIVVKCADVLEAMAFIFEEKKLGNTHGMNALLDDLENRLALYWSHFELRDKYRGMSVHEIAALYEAQIVPPPGAFSHPGLEPA